MAWQAITTDDVKTRLAGAEVAALQSSALAVGQTDPLPEVVGQVVDEVRGYVAAGGNTLDAAGTVPSKLVGATLAIIRYRLATRLPISGLLTEERKAENDAAIRLLERVADRKFAVEEAAAPSSEVIGAPGPKVTGKTLHYGRNSQDGI